jgi:DNA-binding GntR family transcriptional regulator
VTLLEAAVKRIKPDQPAYAVIAQTLRICIKRKKLLPGTVLLEGSLASLFGSGSRSPVKQALQQLQEEGILSRFGGRGVVVGSGTAPVLRIKLTRAQLGLDENTPDVSRVPTWQKIYHPIERELIIRSSFGRFRVNELELSHHYKIGRTVAHEALTQIQSTGIIMKGGKTQWLTVPLDEKRVDDLYALREVIEPVLVARAAFTLPPDALEAMKQRLLDAMKRYPKVDSSDLYALEDDIHITCLEYGQNVEMLEALKRTRCIVILIKHMFGKEMPYSKTDPFFEEHLRIIESLDKRDSERARRAMLMHLESAREKVADRLVAFRKSYSMAPISFISEV